MRERIKSRFEERDDVEKKKQLSLVQERLEASNYQIDHHTICEQRGESQSGKWILQDEVFREWADADAGLHPVLYINGIPGAGTRVF